MKRPQSALVGCTLALLCGTALAQNPSTNPSTNASGNASAFVDATRLDGKKVTNLQGEEVGDIQQVLIDQKSGRVRYAVIKPNPAWQMGTDEVAVPFGALKMSGSPADPTFKVTLDASKEKFAAAPKFKAGEADRLYTRENSQPIYSYWSIYWFEDPATGGSTPPAGSSSGTENPGGSR